MVRGWWFVVVVTMPKWFLPFAGLTAVMFAASPFVIANARYESTMGLV